MRAAAGAAPTIIAAPHPSPLAAHLLRSYAMHFRDGMADRAASERTSAKANRDETSNWWPTNANTRINNDGHERCTTPEREVVDEHTAGVEANEEFKTMNLRRLGIPRIVSLCVSGIKDASLIRAASFSLRQMNNVASNIWSWTTIGTMRQQSRSECAWNRPW
jgi:hypothetical protein